MLEKEIIKEILIEVKKGIKNKNIKNALSKLGINVKIKNQNKTNRFYGYDENFNYIEVLLIKDNWYIIYSFSSSKRAITTTGTGLSRSRFYNPSEIEQSNGLSIGIETNNKNLKDVYKNYFTDQLFYRRNLNRQGTRGFKDVNRKLIYISNKLFTGAHDFNGLMLDISNLRQIIFDRDEGFKKKNLKDISSKEIKSLTKKLRLQTLKKIQSGHSHDYRDNCGWFGFESTWYVFFAPIVNKKFDFKIFELVEFYDKYVKELVKNDLSVELERTSHTYFEFTIDGIDGKFNTDRSQMNKIIKELSMNLREIYNKSSLSTKPARQAMLDIEF